MPSSASPTGRWGTSRRVPRPMGAVPAEVVIATFYNFSPDLVRRAIPEAWALATPDQVPRRPPCRHRRAPSGRDPRRRPRRERDGRGRRAGPHARPKAATPRAGRSTPPTRRCRLARRPHIVLLAWPSPCCASSGATATSPAWSTDEVSGCEALVMHGAMGEVPAGVLQAQPGPHRRRVDRRRRVAAATGLARRRGRAHRGRSIAPARPRGPHRRAGHGAVAAPRRGRLRPAARAGASRSAGPSSGRVRSADDLHDPRRHPAHGRCSTTSRLSVHEVGADASGSRTGPRGVQPRLPRAGLLVAPPAARPWPPAGIPRHRARSARLRRQHPTPTEVTDYDIHPPDRRPGGAARPPRTSTGPSSSATTGAASSSGRCRCCTPTGWPAWSGLNTPVHSALRRCRPTEAVPHGGRRGQLHRRVPGAGRRPTRS